MYVTQQLPFIVHVSRSAQTLHVRKIKLLRLNTVAKTIKSYDKTTNIKCISTVNYSARRTSYGTALPPITVNAATLRTTVDGQSDSGNNSRTKDGRWRIAT
jgi:hypothetical protein